MAADGSKKAGARPDFGVLTETVRDQYLAMTGPPKRQLIRAVTRSVSPPTLRGSASGTPAALVKVRVCEVWKIWSYSMAADQFGAKPYSRPAPTVPPQFV